MFIKSTNNRLWYIITKGNNEMKALEEDQIHVELEQIQQSKVHFNFGSIQRLI